MKKTITILSILVLICFSGHATITNRSYNTVSQKDTLWQEIRQVMIDCAYIKGFMRGYDKQIIPQREKMLAKIWDLGVKYWRSKDSDLQNKKEWIEFVVYNPRIFYNPESNKFDDDERRRVDVLFAKIRSEYLNYLETGLPDSFRNKCWFFDRELVGDFLREEYLYKLTGVIPDLSVLDQKAARLAQLAYDTDFMGTFFLTCRMRVEQSRYGVDRKNVLSFLSLLKKQNLPEVSKWVDQQLNVYKLENEAFEFEARTVDGKLINTASLRGKVVLIDFWSIYCGSCIEYMPVVESMYDKYRQQGFEVISVSVDKESNREQVLKIEHKVGLTSPLAIIGDLPLKKELWLKYGFKGVPQLFLLNKKGHLIRQNSELMNAEGLEYLVKAALAK